ncbi:MAG: AzlC family ABC transporter permease [Granulosicoccaceae bacterium]
MNVSLRWAVFIAGARDTIPMIVGAIPFGILFGTLGVSAGLSWWAVMGMSLFVFAGSSQFVAASLVSQGVGTIVIVITTFVVNLRHGLYAASLGGYLSGLPRRWLLPMGFALTDETYAVVIKHFEIDGDVDGRRWYYAGSACLMYSNWQLCTVLGMLFGQRLQHFGDLGLEFAMVVTFIGIIVPLIRSYPMLLCALVASGVSVVLNFLPHKLGLFAGAIAGISMGLLLHQYFPKADGSLVNDRSADV